MMQMLGVRTGRREDGRRSESLEGSDTGSNAPSNAPGNAAGRRVCCRHNDKGTQPRLSRPLDQTVIESTCHQQGSCGSNGFVLQSEGNKQRCHSSYEEGLVERHRCDSQQHFLLGMGDDVGDGLEAKGYGQHAADATTWTSYAALVGMLCVSVFTYPGLLVPGQVANAWHVWYFGWLAALSSGLGTLPFLVVRDMGRWWLGISNATACGMMLAASASLVREALSLSTSEEQQSIPVTVRVLVGLATGLVFILSTKRLLDQHEDVKVAGLQGLEARKVLLLIFVMTVHAYAEGVGIGVSFGGKSRELGVFISATLAVHNVPEGLAVALVLVPRGVSKLNTALWSIFTSIPQPLMAVPAFLLVEQFSPFLPVGLGFAAGAMGWVAVMELLVEAVEDTKSWSTSVGVACVAFIGMAVVQEVIKEQV